MFNLFFFLYSVRSYNSNRSSSSSSSCSSTSSSCSSCHHNRRSRRRRLASIASIPAIQQQQQRQQQTFPEPDSQSLSPNTVPTTTTSSVQQAAQTTIDPYTAAPNLIRVERIKDVNSGQDVFIRWVSDKNRLSIVNDEQQSSVPQQAYSIQPPINYPHQQLDRELPSEIERLALDDEHLRKSLLFDDRPTSVSSNYKQKKHKKRQKQRDFDNQQMDYEVVNGFFEDRYGKRRPVKLDRARTHTVKDYRHLHNDIVNSSAPQNDRHQALSFIQSPVQRHSFPTPNFPLTNQQLLRPFGTTFLPRAGPFYPQQTFSTAPLFSRPNFMNRVPVSHPSFWYRPM